MFRYLLVAIPFLLMAACNGSAPPDDPLTDIDTTFTPPIELPLEQPMADSAFFPGDEPVDIEPAPVVETPIMGEGSTASSTGTSTSAPTIEAPIMDAVDTLVSSAPPIEETPASDSIKKKSAVLGYSYIPKMRKGEVRDVNVYISATNPGSDVIDSLKVIVQDQSVEKPSDTVIAQYDWQNISYYSFIALELVDIDSAFVITPLRDSRQKITTAYDNTWRWTIKAITDKPSARLIIRGRGELPSAEAVPLKDIDIAIKISIEHPRTFFYKLYDYASNPAVFFPVILVPLVTYFGKRYFDGRKADADKKDA